MSSPDVHETIVLPRLTIHELLRYVYGGVLLMLVAAIWDPGSTKKTIDALGPVMTPLVAVSLGAGVYAIYRAFLGDWFFDPIHDLLHRSVVGPVVWGSKRGAQRNGHSSKRHYLEDHFKVHWLSSLDAFRVIRDRLFSPAVKDRFHRQHSEVHTLYITAVVFLVAAAISCFWPTLLAGGLWALRTLSENPQTAEAAIKGGTELARSWGHILGFLTVGVLAFVAGIVADIALSRQECLVLKQLDEGLVKMLLQKAELAPIEAPPTNAEGEAAQQGSN